MHAWYLLYSKPQQEQLALENLERQGYRTYLPRVRNRRRRQGRYVQVVEPMFPRYLFIYLDDETDDWGPIRSTFGVSKLIRFGDLPARVPGELVTALQARDNEQGIQDLPPPDFKPGERIRIVDGAMAGYEGIFKARTSQERVVILLDIVGKSAPVQLHSGQIEPVK